MRAFTGFLVMITSLSAKAAVIECSAGIQSQYFACPAGTDCRLLKNDITGAPFSWNGEPYQAEIQVTVDSTSCTGFPKDGSPTDLYLSVHGRPLDAASKPAEVIKLGAKHTINLMGPGPIRIFDKDPDWTLGYQAGSFCDIRISCTDTISVSTGSQWLSQVNGLLDQLAINRTFVEGENLLTVYYNTYIGDKTSASWLREEADRMVEFGDELEVTLGNQIIAMLNGANKDEIFKPFTERRAAIASQLLDLGTWESKLTWARDKSQLSFREALARISAAQNPQ